MFVLAVTASLSLLALVRAQQAGILTPEVHPKLQLQECTAGGACTPKDTAVVVDANWRWVHDETGTNCYTGAEWDATLCPDPATCSANCYVDGAEYESTYGITSDGTSLTMKFITQGAGGVNVGSRAYLLETDDTYYMFKPKGMEFTFDVDVSGLPCGLNGALYWSQMDADGGMSKYELNTAGAMYGTGYCDAQCPHDIKFINGEANVIDWSGSESDSNSGTGHFGSCCAELDIWEANSVSSAFTPHVCDTDGQYRCEDLECGDNPDHRYDGLCDKDGCDFNAYRMGDPTFFGEGKTVDTTKPFTVVTQFVTAGNTTTGDLAEIRRVWIQDGTVIQNSKVAVPGMGQYDSVTDDFCAEQKTTFDDPNTFADKGGMAGMGTSLDAGMVLALSIWDDHDASMLWLDSTYPPEKDPTAPGVARGECAPDSGLPADVEASSPDAQVIYSNLKFGPIGSTFTA